MNFPIPLFLYLFATITLSINKNLFFDYLDKNILILTQNEQLYYLKIVHFNVKN